MVTAGEIFRADSEDVVDDESMLGFFDVFEFEHICSIPVFRLGLSFFLFFFLVYYYFLTDHDPTPYPPTPASFRSRDCRNQTAGIQHLGFPIVSPKIFMPVAAAGAAVSMMCGGL